MAMRVCVGSVVSMCSMESRSRASAIFGRMTRARKSASRKKARTNFTVMPHCMLIAAA